MKSKPKPKPLSRKRPANPAAGSLAFFRTAWREALGPRAPQPAVDELARLQYENQQIRARLATLEAMLTSWTLGMVKVQGDWHLLECEKRKDKANDCTCGSKPKVN